MSTIVVWLRRDLRLTDHPALHAAAAQASRVLPVYIHAPDEETPWAPGAASRWWLHHSLAALQRDLTAIGAPLLILRGPTLPALQSLLAAVQPQAVFWNRLYEPAIVARDRLVKETLQAAGVQAHSFNGALLVEPWELETASGGPYRVFTPFWRAASARLRGLAPDRLQPPEHLPAGEPLESLALLPQRRWDGGLAAEWTPGEHGAHQRLDAFAAAALGRYAQARDFPAQAGTSRLSPHLHFGEISPRQLVWRLNALAAEGVTVDPWQRQLIWREFAHHLLYHYPHTADAPLDARFAAFPWRAPDEYAADLKAWQRGRTGIAIVDAGMRELWHTGWMHNRVRMIVASLLTKNLLIPWQEGARWFWDTLVDASLANNTLGWQWTAGCGADAAPYFRVFNPELQSTKFDARGDYRRRWADADAGPSIVDLAATRARALAAYERMRRAGES
jgi:deoxyribodipyrimidine photo-lyase